MTCPNCAELRGKLEAAEKRATIAEMGLGGAVTLAAGQVERLEAQLAEANAGAAAMRGAIESALPFIQYNFASMEHFAGDDTAGACEALEGQRERWEKACDASETGSAEDPELDPTECDCHLAVIRDLDKSLSPSAGRDLLRELEALREGWEAWEAWADGCAAMAHVPGFPLRTERVQAARAAIAAINAGKGEW